MTDLFEPLAFARGPAMKNRFMLAPMTNQQSHPDGRLSDEEFDWLTYRAEGDFGLVPTCAALVQTSGQVWPGQLGVFSDEHLEGLRRLAAGIKRWGAVSVLQLHHGGASALPSLTGEAPRAPSEMTGRAARALKTDEVEALVEDFVAAAVRAEKAGFDGVEIHGAHSYILCAFLSPEKNFRTDRYGGSPENRARIIFDIIEGIRARTGPDFQVGLRISTERNGLNFAEQREVARRAMASGDVDFLDMSLWDVFKEPDDPQFAGKPLIEWFANLPRGRTRLGAAGKLTSAHDVRRLVEHGADFGVIGRAGILHHDFPQRVAADPDFRAIELPATSEHLLNERLSPPFINYVGTNWPGFVAQEGVEAAVG